MKRPSRPGSRTRRSPGHGPHRPPRSIRRADVAMVSPVGEAGALRTDPAVYRFRAGDVVEPLLRGERWNPELRDLPRSTPERPDFVAINEGKCLSCHADRDGKALRRQGRNGRRSLTRSRPSRTAIHPIRRRRSAP